MISDRDVDSSAKLLLDGRGVGGALDVRDAARKPQAPAIRPALDRFPSTVLCFGPTGPEDERPVITTMLFERNRSPRIRVADDRSEDSVIRLQAIDVLTDSDDRHGYLVLIDDALAGVLTRLDGQEHGERTGQWFVEGGFGRYSGSAATFDSLDAAVGWFSAKLPG